VSLWALGVWRERGGARGAARAPRTPNLAPHGREQVTGLSGGARVQVQAHETDRCRSAEATCVAAYGVQPDATAAGKSVSRRHVTPAFSAARSRSRSRPLTLTPYRRRMQNDRARQCMAAFGRARGAPFHR